jgi:hypothetical protein
MMIVNCKRSKRSSACRLESFSLTGWTRARGSGAKASLSKTPAMVGSALHR